jgi:group I intron endonuclease
LLLDFFFLSLPLRAIPVKGKCIKEKTIFSLVSFTFYYLYKSMGIIYKTTCLLNNKIYIGQSSYNVNSYFGSGNLILKAVKKYGKENFKKEILEEGDFTQEELDNLEIKYIQEYNSRDLNIGYNIKKGGYKLTLEDRGKISEANKGKAISEEAKKKISEANKGRIVSEETKLKLTQKLIGNKRMLGKKHSKETKEKIRQASKNKTMSEETKNKLSESLKGRTLSEEHRKKSIVPCYKNAILNQRKILVNNVESNQCITFNSLKECMLHFKIKGTSQLIHCLKYEKLYKKIYKLNYIN